MKLFIGNLSYETTEAEIREVLAPYEPILEFIRPTNRDTGKPRGFAFVTLLDREKGNTAMKELDGVKIAGRTINVNEAEERAPNPRFNNRPTSPSDISKRRVDDRPTDKNGKKIVYKGI